MHRTFRFLFIVALLLVTAYRLPAPIQEVPENPTPAPTVAPPAKPKATPASSKAIEPKPKTKSEPKPSAPRGIRKSNVTPKHVQTIRAYQFEGVWKTVPRANSSYTLVIKGDKSATLTVELTFTLSGGGLKGPNPGNLSISGFPGGGSYWKDLPEQYNSARELRNTYSFDSKESHATDSQIIVRWYPAKLADWSPKSIPKAVIFSIAPDLFKTERREGFTLQGGKLISSNGFTYNRVR